MKKQTPTVTTTAAPFKAIRRAAVPLCAIETADPAQAIKNCIRTLNGKANEYPVMQWDIQNGLRGMNDKGNAYVMKVAGQDARASTMNPSETLTLLCSEPAEKGIVFFHNAHLFIRNESVLQGVWNLRDVYKGVGATLVILCPAMTLPAELKQDVVIISEPLPEAPELSDIVKKICTDAGMDGATIPDLDNVIDTLRGLSAFAAEQVLAMSITKDDAGKLAIDAEGLFSRKRKMIEQTPGLSVWTGGETFDDLGGLDNLKQFLTRVLTSGKTPVRAILYLDEIEKSLAGNSGDTSGTSQDQLGVLLKEMQDNDLPGIILVGPPGTGKSSIAKAAGNVANAPVIACDLGAMKGSLVGESEARIRAAFSVFRAVSQSKGIVVATCNKLTTLPPELKRRFSLGTFYIDLPTDGEREGIWRLWMSRYGITDKTVPQSEGWSGAEIRSCCDVAFRTGYNLEEAATFIVPVIKAAPESVDQLRKLAAGRFISATEKGVFQWPPRQVSTGNRKMEFGS